MKTIRVKVTARDWSEQMTKDFGDKVDMETLSDGSQFGGHAVADLPSDSKSLLEKLSQLPRVDIAKEDGIFILDFQNDYD